MGNSWCRAAAVGKTLRFSDRLRGGCGNSGPSDLACRYRRCITLFLTCVANANLGEVNPVPSSGRFLRPQVLVGGRAQGSADPPGLNSRSVARPSLLRPLVAVAE
jgi:hypothetical protein